METPLSPKVVNAGAAGAASIVLVWVLSLFGIEVPVEVGMAFTVLITAGVAWLTRDKLRDAGQAAVNAPNSTPVGDIEEVRLAA